MPKEELEVLSYTDLTQMILLENGKSLNTPQIFKTICDLLEYSDEDYAAKIGDYYTSLTTDKRFVLLDSAEWDLRDKHPMKIVIDEDDEELEVDEEAEELEEDDVVSEEEEEDIDSIIEDDDLDDVDEDLDDLAIVSEEEVEENEQ